MNRLMHATPERRHGTDVSLPSSSTGPICGVCRTDAYLSFENFIPASYSTEQKGLVPSVVSFSCRHCGHHYHQNAPDGWVPPGWQWYD